LRRQDFTLFFRHRLKEAMMRQPLRCAVAIACLLPAPLLGARTEAVSWGKPGVTIEQYRRDAVECGRAGYYLDVSETEAAHVFKAATGQLESNEASLPSLAMLAGDGPPSERAAAAMDVAGIVGRSAHIVEGTRPQERIRAVGTLMQGTVDDCLRQRGYIRFRLTDAQRRQLGRLHLGSPARHAYLYGLATDPVVLREQATRP
jgi:hypothetical protein